MLQKLSVKNNKWLKMAFNICGDYDLAGDLVQKMYIKIHCLNESEQIEDIKDAFVWGVIRSIFIDSCRKESKVINVPLNNIKELADDYNTFEPDDSDLKILDKSKELRYLYRFYLEESYNKSLRKIAEDNKVNYGKVYRSIKQSKKHILGKNHKQKVNSNNPKGRPKIDKNGRAKR